MRPATRTFVDYLASSYRFPLALAFGAGAGVSAAVMTWFPEFGKGYDPGAILGATLAGAPDPRRGHDRDAQAPAPPLSPGPSPRPAS